MNRNSRATLLVVFFLLGAGLVAWLLTRSSGVGTDLGDAGRAGPAAPVPAGDPAPRPGTEGRPGAVTGTVVVFGTNAPGGGIRVVVTGATGPIEGDTGPDGRFSLRVPSGVELRVEVRSPEPYAPVTVPGILVGPGETESLGTLYLTKGFLVRGIVVDAGGGGLPNARVRAFRPETADMSPNILSLVMALGRPRVALSESRSGPDGAFVLAGLSPGTYRLEADAEGYAVGSLAEAVVSPETEGQAFRIVLGRGVTLSGRVTEAGGAPVPGATVTVVRADRAFREDLDFSPTQATASEEGKYRFPALAPGRVALIATAEGYPMRIVNELNLVGEQTLDIVIGGTSTLTGKVTGPGDAAVPGARVLVVMDFSGGALGRAVADEEGRYRIDRLTAGRIEMLSVEADGFSGWPAGDAMQARQRGFGELKAGETLTKDFALLKGARIFGVVRDAASGRAIEGARVRLLGGMDFGGMGGGGRSAVSDAEGAYAIEGVGVGAWLVLASAGGYYQEGTDASSFGRLFAFSAPNQEPGPDDPVVKIAADQGEVLKNVPLRPGATLSGVVTDPDGRPVAGAKVAPDSGDRQQAMISRLLQIAPAAVLTDGEGRFRYSGAAAGETVRLSARAPGFVDGLSDPLVVRGGEALEDIRIRLRAGGSIAGTVVGPDGLPVEGAVVRVAADTAEMQDWNLTWAFRQAEPTPADAQGGFRVTGLAPGDFALSVESPTHLTLVRRRIAVTEGGVADAGAIRLEAGLFLEGTVTDETGRPVPGARVSASAEAGPGPRTPPGFDQRANAQTDAEGAFRLGPLAAGPYTLSATAEGYAPSGTKATAGDSRVAILLAPGLEIEGQVVLPDGGPAAQVQVTAFRRNPDGGEAGTGAQTDAEGRFRFEGLRSGEYRIAVSPQRFGFGPGVAGPSFRETSVDGVAAGTRGLLVRLEPGLEITGTVVDENGAAVSGAFVFARSTAPGAGGPSTSFAQTDANGDFRLRGLAPGAYAISANAGGPGGPPRTGSTENVSAGASGVRLTLAPMAPPAGGPPAPRPGPVPPRPR